jgi:hypothetical protein
MTVLPQTWWRWRRELRVDKEHESTFLGRCGARCGAGGQSGYPVKTCAVEGVGVASPWVVPCAWSSRLGSDSGAMQAASAAKNGSILSSEELGPRSQKTVRAS